VTVVDLEDGEVAARLDLGGRAFTGTWNVSRSKLYVPVQTSGEVAVIDATDREIIERLDVGAEPYGATAATIRGKGGGQTASLDHVAEYDTTYCMGQCACGHQL
jgi:hypothetical protein